MLTVNLNDDASTTRQQQQKVHPEPQQSVWPTLPHRLGVPVEPDLRKQS